jgi:D-alanine-D-alanine ligase
LRNIGITYDLRDDYLAAGYSKEETAEFDRVDTIDALEGSLLEHGYSVQRIGNIRALVEHLAAGERWDMVFNIAEGLHGFGREAQIPALLEAYRIPYTFSDSLVLSLTLHKGMTKDVVRALGIPTPDFVVLQTPADLPQVRLPFPLFAKPVAEGTGKGINAASRISSPADLEVICRQLLEKFDQPVLVETYLPGREFTVGIVGTGPEAVVLGVAEVLLKDNAEQNAYSYVNKERYAELVEYRLVDDEAAGRAAEIALAAWRGLGCRDGGRVDLRADAAGQPCFIEVNPLAGLHPRHSDLPIICTLKGISYHQLIGFIMDSAWKRQGMLGGDAA